ncbi:MAG: ClbS/DfsB family four-helix bundle protein [Anaerolineae bacterium]|nr:ClbS/DfsB family four-helix bundle protein [Anaerolineae bacterium]
MRKNELLDTLDTSHADLLGSLTGLTQEQMIQPGVIGVWSVKDTLAHLVAWEAEVVTALNQAQNRQVPSIIHIEDVDEWNEIQYHVNAERHLEAIQADLTSVHKMLRHMIEDFDERLLTDNRCYSWMEGEPLWFLVEDAVVLHEQEHAGEIRAWREQQGF